MSNSDQQTEWSVSSPSILVQLRILLSRRHLGQMVLLVGGMFVAAMLETIGIGSIPVFVSLLIDPQQTQSFVPFFSLENWLEGKEQGQIIVAGATGLVIFFAAKNLYLASLVFAEGRVLRNICAGIASRLFRAYLHSPYLLHLQRNPALTLRNVTTEVDQTRLLLRQTVLAIRETLVLVLILALLIAADPATSVATFTILGLAATAFIVTVRKRLFRSGQILQDSRSGQLQKINQGLGSLKVAKIHHREPYLIAAFDRETFSKEGENFFQRFLSSMPRLFLETTAICAVLIVVLSFSYLGRDTNSLLPVLALLAISVVRLVPAITTITTGMTQIQVGKAAVNAIVSDLKLFEGAANDQSGTVPFDFGSENQKGKGAISINDVSFQFPNTDISTLENVSLNIASGEAVGVVGPSGSGKSTLVDIMLGLLTPKAGSVFVDGVNIHQGSGAQKIRFGYIPQEIYLLDDTIRKNIAFGLPPDDISEPDVVRAAKDAQLHGFIKGLPDGYDTVVGDRGARLSGGQRQRIGIARALYHNPSVLVMDEATSALDGKTEDEVIGAIRKIRGSRTIITIAHRLNTIRDCDRIFKLEDGRLVAEGTYEDVLGETG